MSHYEPRHAKTIPFTETARYKAIVVTAASAVSAGVAAGGGAAATHYSHPGAGVAYTMAVTDHADPNHVDLPEPGRELIASLASLTVLSAKLAARAERITDCEYLDRLVQLWTDSPA